VTRQTERQLSQRKAAILRALVQHYIRTGEPVGSEALAQAAGLSVSSATIRSELAALEELGYLTQPHTSAGRAPTELAYRHYVDLLPSRPRLRDAERRQIVHFFDEALSDVDQILRGTTVLLSRLTRYASLALAPSPREAGIAQAELISLGTSTLLLVVFDTGQVEKRLLELPVDLTKEDQQAASAALAEHVRSSTLSGARAALAGVEGLSETRQVVFDRLIEALASIEQAAASEHVFLGGMANIAAAEAFDRREGLRQMLETLEREQAVLMVLRETAASGSLGVVIGHENPVPEMWATSVVAASYAAGNATGTIGVVGPLRMDYASAMSAVRAVADRLSAVVETLSH
jgi:heat-inducible transcriptional repressor